MAQRLHPLFSIALILGMSLVWGQTEPADSLSTNQAVAKDSLAKNTKGLGDQKLEGSIAKDSSSRAFQDVPQLAAIDSLWLREIYNSSLFDSIYRSVTEDPAKTIDYPELSTEVLKERLLLLNQRTPFNVEYNPSLERVIKRFLKNRPQSLTRLMELSQFYFPMFEEKLDQYDIPLEMKYLAIVESALNPRARSRVGATGLWQFMFATGRQFDLEVSSYVDERSDPQQATEAACKYLSSLYRTFGDWDLALAAYNSGPGNVSKAIRRSGGYKNYWNIRPYLPRETAGYVPLFLATMYVFEFAEEHGFKPRQFERPFFVSDTIHVKELVTFDQISEKLSMLVEELEFYNPQYKLNIIPKIEGRTFPLRLPINKMGIFVTNEADIYALAKAENAQREKPLPQLFAIDSKIRYRVRSGDYLGKIANKYGVTVSQIKRWNGLRSSNLRIGQRLTIFPKKIPKGNSGASSKGASSTPKGKGTTYTVRSGDSLWSIAQKYPGVSVDQLKKWNNIKGNQLKPGMKLVVSK